MGAGFPPGGRILQRLPGHLGLQERGMQAGEPPELHCGCMILRAPVALGGFLGCRQPRR